MVGCNNLLATCIFYAEVQEGREGIYRGYRICREDFWNGGDEYVYYNFWDIAFCAVFNVCVRYFADDFSVGFGAVFWAIIGPKNRVDFEGWYQYNRRAFY